MADGINSAFKGLNKVFIYLVNSVAFLFVHKAMRTDGFALRNTRISK